MRSARVKRRGLDADPRFAFVWFDLTEAGRDAAQEVLARLPDLDG